MDEPLAPGTLPATAAETAPDAPWPLRVLSENLKRYFERAPQAWIEGQLIEFKLIRGNAWMTLRDLDADYSLPVTAWRNVAATLDGTVEQGSRVVACVKPSFYTKTGKLSMVASAMRPVGLGDLLARVEKLRRTLEAEGLFSPERKKPLPVLPQLIGLVTGRDSDAMKDVMRNTHLRWPAARFEVREVAVQGANAPREVMAAVAELDAHPEVDVIVIARGGGALEEVVLPFSDEALVRAVAATRTPVVSAIGHEADRPVLDDVADLRASTPTDAAKRIVPDAAVEREAIAGARLRLASGVERLVLHEAQQLQSLRTRPVLANPERMMSERTDDLAPHRTPWTVATPWSSTEARWCAMPAGSPPAMPWTSWWPPDASPPPPPEPARAPQRRLDEHPQPHPRRPGRDRRRHRRGGVLRRGHLGHRPDELRTGPGRTGRDRDPAGDRRCRAGGVPGAVGAW
jgi:exodeoxyribonuclease VII large subunit